MHLELITTRLKNTISNPEVVVGNSRTLHDRTALMIDISNTSVLPHFQHLIVSGLLLSSRTVLAEISGDIASWQLLIDMLAKNDASNCISSISWRKSNGGRAWIRPHLLQQELRNRQALDKAKTNGRELGADTALTALISLAGQSFGGDPGLLQAATIEKIAEIIRRPIAENTAKTTLLEDQWMTINRPGTNDWSGQVRLRLRTQEDLELLHRALHGTPIWLGAAWTHISIVNPMLPVVAGPQPGGHSGRGNGRPSRR